MPPWSRILVEVFTKQGCEGYEITPEPERAALTEDDLNDLVRGSIRADKRLANAMIRYCEDGHDLIVGVFVGTVPTGPPNRGQIYKPDEMAGPDAT